MRKGAYSNHQKFKVKIVENSVGKKILLREMHKQNKRKFYRIAGIKLTLDMVEFSIIMQKCSINTSVLYLGKSQMIWDRMMMKSFPF